jgi:ribosomal protein S18 acetylase RimI-like enzyme
MTEPEYDTFAATSLEGYIAERVAANDSTPAVERAAATQQMAEILPQGFRTTDHRFWQVIEPGGAVIGTLWVMLDDAQRRAFIYDIEIDEAQRGKGYGAATMQALEDELRPTNLTHIGLNVFGPNTVARALYDKMGYQVAATFMLKRISDGA